MKMAGGIYPSGAARDEVDEELFGRFAFCDELLNRIYKFLEVVNTTFQQLHIQGTRSSQLVPCCIWPFLVIKLYTFFYFFFLTMKSALLKQGTTFYDKHEHICRRTLKS